MIALSEKRRGARTTVVRLPLNIVEEAERVRREREGGNDILGIIATLGLGAFLGYIVANFIRDLEEKEKSEKVK